MTVPSQDPINQYTANGVTTVFAYTFRIDSESDIKIYSGDTVISSGFTVSGVGVNTGGSVTFSTAPVSGAIISILRNMTPLRATDYQNSGDFRAETANGDFDKLWLYMQQMRRDLDKTLHRKENDTYATSLNVLPAPETGKALAWGSDGAVVNRSVDQTTIIGNGEASDLSAGVMFNAVADMKNLTAADGRTLDIAALLPSASSTAFVSTVANNTTSKKGGATYEIKTRAQHRTDIGNPTWVPDGRLNHYLLGGTTYVAVAVVKNAWIDIDIMGAIPGQDIAEILASAESSKFRIRGDFVCGTVTRAALDLQLVSATINPPDDTTDYLFLNIPDLRIEARGHCDIGDVTPYVERVYYVESGQNLNRLEVSGDLLIDCQDTTKSGFAAASGVAPSTSLKVDVQDVEITGFTTSGIDLRCDAMDDETSVYIGRVKAHSGSGRCIQLGDNTYGVNQITVRDCPRLGDVSSTGSSEAKGVICYGRNVTIDNNTINRVKNEGTTGAEGIYIKSAFARIINNNLLNAGSSTDGCITLKGASYWGGLYSDEGGYSIVAFNTVEITSDDHVGKGIGVFDSNVTVIGNILTDMRAGRGADEQSQAISIGGSEPVSNVVVTGNISTGWRNFSGEYADSAKGRGRIGDNITISDNIVTELAGGNFFCWEADCVIETRPMVFDAATKTITITGGTSQNGQFERWVYPPGSTIVIANTTSNNGTYTVDTVSRYVLTVLESLVDESDPNPVITREAIKSLKITGNTCSGFGSALRNGGNGHVNQVIIDNNHWRDGVYAYRMEVTDGIGDLIIGAGETWDNVTDPYYGSAQEADEIYAGVKIKGVPAAGSMTMYGSDGLEYVVAYT